MALALGKTVEELSHISLTELAEWQIYDNLCPFGLERDDILTAKICQTVVNINRGKGKSPYKIKDFITFKRIGSAVKKQSMDEMKQVMMSMVAPLKKSQQERKCPKR